MAKAWIFQKSVQVGELGVKAPYYVGWYEPDGRRKAQSCGPGFHGKKNAERLCRKLEAELTEGTYQARGRSRKRWDDFRSEYRDRVLAGRSRPTRIKAELTLDHFERIIKPQRLASIKTQHVDEFIAERRKEPGQKKRSIVSPATVNCDLRHIKAALRVAHEWGYLPNVPKFRMEKEPGKLATYVTGDHFAAIYQACDTAKMPADVPNITAPDWWRALIVTGYMTGWRIGDMLAMRRDRLDLDAGTVVSLAEDNKGKRDELVRLHPVVIDHLRRLAGFTPTLFPWNHDRRTLYVEFTRIQNAARVRLPCSEEHEHTPACYVYSFHDLRRAFATMNADKLTPDALQALMRHRSYQTTQKYIALARQMDAAVASLHVPEVLRKVGK
jgi:integrase